MIPAHAGKYQERGFTLIETLIVMVVLGIAAVTIAGLSGNLFQGQTENRQIVVGSQLMQECAELMLAKARENYADSCLASAGAATDCCSTFTTPGYSAPEVTLLSTGNSSSSEMGACPYSTGSDCKLLKISQGGMKPVVLMLNLH